MKKLVLILLNLCLYLFLADALFSLADDTLILFFGVHGLSRLREVVFLLAFIVAILVYGLMGLIPTIPKRWFLPVTLFNPVAMLAVIPCMIYGYDRIQQAGWVVSICQVIFGLGILCWIQGGFTFRLPLVQPDRLRDRRFSWLNLSVFLLANAFVLLPAVLLYLAVCASLALDHFSGGFLTCRPGGLTVRVRTYVRDDGRTVQLVPMAHIGEAEFYHQISQLFPSNSIILMEGVTDNKRLITNTISYKRMATAVGLAEQEEEFAPTQGEMVPADVDTEEFSTNTISFLNLAMLLHSQGINAETVMTLIRYSADVDLEEQLINDLLKKRNRRVLQEIQARLPQSEHIVVPWGVAHMPEIAEAIQKSGFRLGESRDYVVIRFHPARKGKPPRRSGDGPGKPDGANGERLH